MGDASPKSPKSSKSNLDIVQSAASSVVNESEAAGSQHVQKRTYVEELISSYQSATEIQEKNKIKLELLIHFVMFRMSNAREFDKIGTALYRLLLQEVKGEIDLTWVMASLLSQVNLLTHPDVVNQILSQVLPENEIPNFSSNAAQSWVEKPDFKEGYYSGLISLTKPNIHDSAILSDWKRLYDTDTAINGQSIKEISDQNNKFSSDSDLENLFRTIILKDVAFKNSEDADHAVNYLRTAFHQGGLIFPISAPVATMFFANSIDRDNKLGYLSTVSVSANDEEQPKRMVRIQTHSKGFTVSEHYECPILGYGPGTHFAWPDDDPDQDEDPFKLEADPGNPNIISCDAIVTVDFSKDPSNPEIIEVKNGICFGNKELEEYATPFLLLDKARDEYINALIACNEIKLRQKYSKPAELKLWATQEELTSRLNYKLPKRNATAKDLMEYCIEADLNYKLTVEQKYEIWTLTRLIANATCKPGELQYEFAKAYDKEVIQAKTRAKWDPMTNERKRSLTKFCLVLFGIAVIAASIALLVASHGAATPVTIMGIKLGATLLVGTDAALGASGFSFGIAYACMVKRDRQRWPESHRIQHLKTDKERLIEKDGVTTYTPPKKTRW